MFNSVDLSGMDEILLWRQYSTSSDATSTHWTVDYLQRNGSGNTGYTRSMVDSYLMENGLPIYAAGSGYEGDDTYEHLFSGRDPRMGMCIDKTGDLLSEDPNLIEYVKSDGRGYFYRSPIFEGQLENGNPTGYSLRKGLNTSGDMHPTLPSYTGCPTFRAAEAYLNYIEAYYELNGNLGGNCDTYWKALRSRAGVSTDYQLTINNTDMSKETLDWGSYSIGKQVDATLYNIRRERRIELVSEGFRFNDLKRWRALDQVQNVHLQGFNFWESMYQLYTNPTPEDAMTAGEKEAIVRMIYQLRQDVDYLKSVIAGNAPAEDRGMRLIGNRTGNAEDAFRDKPDTAFGPAGDQSPDVFAGREAPEEQQGSMVMKENPEPEEQTVANLSIEKTELELIKRALDKYRGNRKLAAEELGISERTLYRKLKSLDK